MPIENDLPLIKFLWSLILIPFGWLWRHAYLNRQKIYEVERDIIERIDELELHLSNNYMKEKDIIYFTDRTITPLHKKLDEISSNVEYLRRSLNK